MWSKGGISWIRLWIMELRYVRNALISLVSAAEENHDAG
jgi:hypothetical protein